MSYIVHFDWNHWQEQLYFSSAESVKQWLTSGFVPEGCVITVEYNNVVHKWDREANYAKPYRRGKITPALSRQFEKDKATSVWMQEYLARGKKGKAAV